MIFRVRRKTGHALTLRYARIQEKWREGEMGDFVQEKWREGEMGDFVQLVPGVDRPAHRGGHAGSHEGLLQLPPT